MQAERGYRGRVDGADEQGWSAVAGTWAELWGGFSDPVRRAIVEVTGITAGSRVLDIGCGSGEFAVMLRDLGVEVAGLDPAPAMVAAALRAANGADIRLGSFESLPWGGATFDVVTAVNALQFAGDTLAALAEAARVTAPGGYIAVANWAEGRRNDLDVIERAVAAADGDDVAPDGDLRMPGGLETVLRDAGLEVVTAQLIDVPWEVANVEELVRGVLMGEDPGRMAELAPTVEAAAIPFRTDGGGYRVVNVFRMAVARVVPESHA